MLLNHMYRVGYLVLITVPFLSFSNSSANTQPTPSQIESISAELKNEVTESATLFRSRLNTHMQNSAQWLDKLVKDDNAKGDIASAKGYISLGFAPRARDLLDFDNQFKVSLDLPNWEEKVSLIIDNDEEEEDRLPLQSISTEQNNNINAALNWYMVQRKRWNVEHRIGFSRSNLFAQTRLKFRHTINDWRFSVSPSIEYYLEDGVGARLYTRADVKLTPHQILNFAFNTRYVESEPTKRVSIGVFHSQTYNQDQAGVIGAWANDSFSGERSYYASYRWRMRFFEHWLFFEAEPFVEFRERYDFDDEPGIALRLIAYYGV
ncbi:hypothetical protein AAEU29_12885 [Pseudoalteromonas sp. SSM20]|uniref:hypothetical protein n=1 Tax=Pseudoalteromonas sp. SSM20 TaxID=3139394 RepID=UPI003BAA611C